MSGIISTVNNAPLGRNSGAFSPLPIDLGVGGSGAACLHSEAYGILSRLELELPAGEAQTWITELSGLLHAQEMGFPTDGARARRLSAAIADAERCYRQPRQTEPILDGGNLHGLLSGVFTPASVATVPPATLTGSAPLAGLDLGALIAGPSLFD